MVGGRQFVDSTVATRLNGFVAGLGDPARRKELLAEPEFPPSVLSERRRRF